MDYILTINYNQFALAKLVTIKFPLTILRSDCMTWQGSAIYLSKCYIDTTTNIIYAYIDKGFTYTGAQNLIIKTMGDSVRNPDKTVLALSAMTLDVKVYGGLDADIASQNPLSSHTNIPESLNNIIYLKEGIPIPLPGPEYEDPSNANLGPPKFFKVMDLPLAEDNCL